MAAAARWLLLVLAVSAAMAAASGKKHERRWRMSGAVGGQVVEKERRRVVAESEAGTVAAVDIADAAGAAYRLHFITMDPGALFLPVQLHADMVFYVHSGRGKVTYIEEDSSEQSSLEVERGDVYNLEQGSILYIQSYPNATRQRLRIYAIFTSEAINAEDPSKPKVEVYSSVSNLVKGFAKEVLRLGFGVRAEVVEAIKSAKTPPQIIPYNPAEEKRPEDKSSWTEDMVDALLGVRDPEEFLNKKKKKDKDKKSKDKKKSKSKAFNFYSGKPDVENCYGWSRTMTNKDLDALHGSSIGMFMVNLTTGSMMGPHWNPKATEIAIVTGGSGIVQTVCPSGSSSSPSPSPSSAEGRRGRRGHERGGRPGGRRGDEGEGDEGRRPRCRNSVFRVKEGDVFVVPRFHPMAQMSFNNDSFVFVGFSTHMGQNHPQFLAGKGSVLQAIGKEVLARSLGQKNTTAVEKLLSAQRDSTIMSCISCAEELEEKAAKQEEEEKEREEEERREREKEKEREEEERREREKEKEREEEERRERETEKEREEEERREQEEKEREREEEEERRREKEEEEREKEKEREEDEERARRKEEERAREEEERRREEEEGGGSGRGDEEPEEEGGDEPPYRLSKKLKKRYRAAMFRSG